MIELKIGESVSLTNGAPAKIVKELGRGGQGIVYLVDENFNDDVYFDISIYMYGANNLWTITVCKTDDTPLKTIEVDQSTPLNNAFTELVDPLVDYLKEIPLQLS